MNKAVCLSQGVCALSIPLPQFSLSLPVLHFLTTSYLVFLIQSFKISIFVSAHCYLLLSTLFPHFLPLWVWPFSLLSPNVLARLSLFLSVCYSPSLHLSCALRCGVKSSCHITNTSGLHALLFLLLMTCDPDSHDCLS